MQKEEALGNVESPHASIEELQSKLSEVMAVLFEEKVGFMTDEIRERLKNYAAETHIFTDKNSIIQFLIKGFDKEGLHVNEKFMGFIFHFVLLEVAGFVMKSEDQFIIFTNNGSKKMFLHEVSHLVENVISELVKNGSLDAVRAQELDNEVGKESKKYKTIRIRGLISSVGFLTIMASMGTLFVTSDNGVSDTNLYLLFAAHALFSFTWMHTHTHYLRMGGERRARQAEKLAGQFF